MKTWDPKGLVVTLGPWIISGFAESSALSAERNKDSFTLKKGCDGEGVRMKSADLSGTVKLSLMGSSQSNDYLTGLSEADRLAGAGVKPLLVKDINGTTVLESAKTWVKKPAAVAMGAEVGDREWTLECDELFMYVGGSL